LKTVTRERLQFLIATVEHELARIDERCGKPPEWGQEGYYRDREAYWKKHKSVVAESILRLAVEGAVCTFTPPHEHAIRLAGFRSSSTSSYMGAFRNWLISARKRLEREAA
jgi:hypothetical protein